MEKAVTLVWEKYKTAGEGGLLRREGNFGV